MRFENIRSIKPLTKLMIQLLQDLKHKNISGSEFTDQYDEETINGLLERGLVIVASTVNEKPFTEYSLTKLGREYLDHYFPAS